MYSTKLLPIHAGSDTPASGTTSNAPIESEPVEQLNLLIEVPKAKQVNKTWNLFRKLLANSANKFINVTGINTENCRLFPQFVPYSVRLFDLNMCV